MADGKPSISEKIARQIAQIAKESVKIDIEILQFLKEDFDEIRKLAKEDGAVDWSQPAATIRNRIRAFDPWPGSTFKLPSGQVSKVWKTALEAGDGTPGELLDNRLLVATGEGALRLLEIQPPGKKRMPATSFLNGYPIEKGEILG